MRSLYSKKKIDRSTEECVSTLHQIEGELNSLLQQTKSLEEQIASKMESLDKLRNPEKHIADLTQLTEDRSKRLISLAQEWEQHRQPLINQYRRKKQQLQDRKAEVSVKLELIKRMRDDMKQLATTVREKDEVHKQASDEFNKLPKAVNRQVYVRRIMEFMKNVDKQKIEIKKILEDVHKLQKDINALTETSKRTFVVAEDVVFSAASDKRDPVAVQTYKNLVSLRNSFEKLVQAVENTGKIKNDIMDIQAKTQALEEKNKNLKTEVVLEDLAQVKNENKGLVAKLKAFKKDVQD